MVDKRLGEVGNPSASTLRVCELDTGDSRWESFVAGHPEALPYHYPAWSQALAETFGFRPAALGCIDGSGQLTGILPLMEKKSVLAGAYLSSLPCTPVAGPYGDSPASLQALMSAAAAGISGSAARWLQIKTMNCALNAAAAGFSSATWDPIYVLDLPDDPAKIRFGGSRNHSDVLRMVRQANRQGVAVREASSLQDVRGWYRLYLETMRIHAVPPRPFRFFEVIWDVLPPEHRRLLLAEKQIGGLTQLIGGCFFLMGGRSVVFAFNARDGDRLHLRPNDAIHWRAIRDACAAGFSRYDFGEAAAFNPGLQHFKRKWGTREETTCRFQYPARQEIERSVLSPGTLRNTAERVWRHVPTPVTARLGAWIYRRL